MIWALAHGCVLVRVFSGDSSHISYFNRFNILIKQILKNWKGKNRMFRDHARSKCRKKQKEKVGIIEHGHEEMGIHGAWPQTSAE